MQNFEIFKWKKNLTWIIHKTILKFVGGVDKKLGWPSRKELSKKKVDQGKMTQDLTRSKENFEICNLDENCNQDHPYSNFQLCWRSR